MIVNLLRNAIDASPENGAVTLCVRLESGHIRITVTDAGPGIPPELLPTLFTPFFTSKPKGAGHGLGLVISRELARAMGGELSLSSNMPPDSGCTATVILPPAEPAA